MIACFFWHFSWQMVNWVEQNAVFGSLVDLFFPASVRNVVAKEGFFDVCKSVCQFDWAFVVSGDIAHSHESVGSIFVCFMQVIVSESPWVLWFPVNALDQPRHVGKVLVKLAFKCIWVLIILLFIEGKTLLVFDQVFGCKHRNNDCFVWTLLTFVLLHIALQVVRLYFHMWQLLKDLHNSLRDASGSCDCKYHWWHFNGDPSLFNVGCNSL